MPEVWGDLYANVRPAAGGRFFCNLFPLWNPLMATFGRDAAATTPLIQQDAAAYL